MPFDQSRYENEVVRPLRGKLTALPDDLVARYAIEPAMTAGQLERRLREVRAYWNNKARSMSAVGQVCAAFLREDERLKAKPGVTLTDPAWWRTHDAERARARPAAITALTTELQSFYGALGALTAEQLDVAAGAHPSLSADEVDQAARAARLRVVPARELPRTSGLGRDAYRAIVDGLVPAGASSIPKLLHPQCGEFTLLDRFGGTPAPAGGLDAAAVTAALGVLDRARDSATSGAAKHALGRLRSAAAQGVDLHALALVHVLDEARAQHAARAMPSGIKRCLERCDLGEAEARALTVQVLAESPQAADPLAELRALLAEGKPKAAGRLLAGLDAESAAEGRALLEARTAEVEALRAAADEALRADRPDLAEQKLRAALDVAADHTDLAEQLARLPLLPVRAVDVSPDGAGVRVSWTAPTSHAEDTHYRVVRRDDRSPRDGADGQVVGTASAGFLLDPAPPVGRTVYYAVLAARAPEGPWSAPVPGALRVVPPVTAVEVSGESTAVVARWTAHRDAVRVRVRRFDRPPGVGGASTEVPAGPRGFTDTAAVEGASHHYELVAVYADPAGGRELCSAAVVVRGGRRADSAPVAELEVTGDGDPVEPRVVVRWRTPPGAEVEVRVARTPPPGRYGDSVPRAEVESWGAALDGVPREEGDWTSVRPTVPSGRLHYAAFTHGPSGTVRGRAAVCDLVTPVRQIRAQRRGDATVLSWVWSDDVTVAEVSWAGGGVRLTRAQYREQGGLPLPPEATGTVEVRAVAGAGEERSVSAPVPVEVAVPRRSVRYTLNAQGSRLRGTRECVVSVPPGQGTGRVEVLLVAARGRVMPLSPDAGDVIARADVDLDAAEPAEIRVPYPRLPKPFWLRCFPGGDDVVLLDPPVSELKVS